MVQIKRDWFDTALKNYERGKRMVDGKRRYKSDRKDHKVSVKLSEKDMDILKAALNRTGMTASAYIRELIRTGGNIDTSYPEDRARAIRIIAGIANILHLTILKAKLSSFKYICIVSYPENSSASIVLSFEKIIVLSSS